MKKVVIFGASGGGRKMYNFIKQFEGYEVCLFLDNFPKHSTYLGLDVMKPEQFLIGNDIKQYYYCIGSSYWLEIYAQLTEYGIPKNHIYSKQDILLENKSWFMECLINNMNYNNSIKPNKKSTVIFDLLNGFGLGGVEKWSYDVAREYMSENKVVLLGNRTKGNPPMDLEKNTFFIDVEDGNDYNMLSIKAIIEFLKEHLPCTVYCAHINDLFIACMLLKEVVGKQINLISVIHGGLKNILDENIELYDSVDYYLCVSPDSMKYLQENSNTVKQKVLFKESPVTIPCLKGREYSLDKGCPIKISYAARLEKLHKHSELLIPLIMQLEKRKVNYSLDVAGDGTLFKQLCEFVENNYLNDKVNMHGRLGYEEMQSFWLKHDISINLSDTEGCSISMLESMAAGAVPIYTNVSSTKHFIINDWNGYYVEFGDIDKMVDYIENLDEDRDKIERMGLRSAQIINERCRIEEYIKYLKQNIRNND